MTIYKTLDGTSGAYGYGCWSLPTLNSDGTYTPGGWMPPVKPALCKSSYHACRDLSEVVIHLASGIYELEPADLETTMRIARECGTEWDPSWPIVDEGDDKAAYACARLTRRLGADTWTSEAQALWAVDCARMVAHLTTNPELIHACLDVAVARVLYGKEWDAARYAAWGAARDASWEVARAVAQVAAAAAARASWAAARAVAQVAAAAAARAARAAAREAALEAARDALSQQAAILERYLAGEQGPLVEGVRA